MSVHFYLRFLSLVLCIPSIVLANGLDTLEASATKPVTRASQNTQPEKKTAQSNNSDSSNTFIGALAEVTAMMIIAGGENSLARLTNNRANDKSEYFRKKGDPLLPMVRLNTQFLSGSQDTTAHISRLEGGFGFLGFSHTQSHLYQGDKTLSTQYTLVHYRMSYGNDMSWDFAIGEGLMSGNQDYSGSVFAMPIRIRYSPSIHFEYYPVWSSYNGGAMSEHQLAIHWQKQFFGMSFGVKNWVSDLNEINGAFFGLSASY